MPLESSSVTFVFTDIEGSTRLLAAHPGAYPEVVATQRQVIVDAARARGGTVIGHEGDSCFIVFRDPAAAIEAAGLAQQSLHDREWPEGVVVRVRMGIHTGEAEISGGSYFGLAVHIAARVAAATHGGQVLMSAATRDAGLPPGWSTRDMGAYRLRDIERPIHLHQLVGGGLPVDFPAPRALPPEISLRTPPTSFVGRDQDVAAVIDLLRENRLVTLVGPGGIGKTRLALDVGARTAVSFPDGVWFADLTRTHDSALVGEIVADAVGVSVPAGGEPVRAVAEFFAHRQALLIADNFEHVIGAAPVVARLVEAAPHLVVLATSRERLRLSGEQTYEVAPLELGRGGAAADLFRERAVAANPAFDPTEDDLDAIATICTRLDGLPLAIELAAARSRVFPPAELAERIAEQPMSLSGGPRDLHTRQQTIRNTLEWSYQLLTPAEQDLLTGMAVFAGPVPLDAVEAIVAGGNGGSVDELLTDLVDKSLVRQRGDTEARFDMLELVREFAGELLADRPDQAELRAVHAAYYTDRAETAGAALLTSRPHWWAGRMEDELAETTRAFEWCVEHDPVAAVRLFGALGFYFHMVGLTHIARRWSDLVAGIPVPAGLAIRRSIGRGFVHFGFREMEEARAEWQAAMEAARACGDRLREGWASMNLGASFIGRPQDHDHAIALVHAGLELAEQSGSPVLMGLGYNIAGELFRVHGDDEAADAAYGAGVAVATEIGDHQRVAILHGNRIYTATRRGDLTAAVEFARAAVELHHRHGYRNQLPWVSIALAGALARQGLIEEAAVLVAAAEESARKMRLEELPGDVGENRQIRALIAERAGERLPLWQERGRSMSLDAAIDAALRAATEVPPLVCPP